RHRESLAARRGGQGGDRLRDDRDIRDRAPRVAAARVDSSPSTRRLPWLLAGGGLLFAWPPILAVRRVPRRGRARICGRERSVLRSAIRRPRPEPRTLKWRRQVAARERDAGIRRLQRNPRRTWLTDCGSLARRAIGRPTQDSGARRRRHRADTGFRAVRGARERSRNPRRGAPAI